MAGTAIGESIARKEDRRLLTGTGRFTDDLNEAGQAYACFLRSPHAHADIARIDTAKAASLPGVLTVLTAREYVADGLGALTHYANVADHLDPSKPSFTPGELPPLPAGLPIAPDRVRHVGEIVAIAVAETPDFALDALERVKVDYAPLPAVTDVRAAVMASAPRIWDRDNVCVMAENGDGAATDAMFASAYRIVRCGLLNHRVNGCPIEPRAAIGTFDAGRGVYTLQAPSQGVHRYKSALATALGVRPEAVRVVTGDVGGGFGLRSACNSEYPLLLWAARRIGRPVKWTASRSDAFLSDYQARDVLCEGAIALDDTGRILAARFEYLGNVGAHPVTLAVLANLLRMSGPAYDVPSMHVSVRGAFTNTVPVSVFRGAGRPEVTHLLERLIDLAAAEFGMDRTELRRRNLIPGALLPYRSALGLLYESGAFTKNFDTAVRAIDWHGFADRRAKAAARGRLAGIGIANYLESPAGAPNERTDIRILTEESRVEAVIGTQASGQGHETTFAQVVSATLEIPIERVSIVFGDSDQAVTGGGTHADRSMRLAGTVILRACKDIIERGREIAAHLLEAAVSDIGYSDGRFTVLGTDRSVDLFEAAEATERGSTPEGLSSPLQTTNQISTRLHAHPNGVAACEVEIDPETGTLQILRYVTVDDVGRVINPMIVEGQIHGGIAQGIGQALFEQSAYDAGSGQLICGSFMDYCLPRASDLPAFLCMAVGLAAPSNPLGVKGAGEAGTTPATAAVVGAIADALRDHGVTHLDMPVTSERIWRAIRSPPPEPHPLRPHS